MTTEMSRIFYRFRSTVALIGEYQEIARREIYFAAPEELNDPLEGYADVVWTGDPILWQNLLRHYILVLVWGIADVATTAEPFDPTFLNKFVDRTDVNFEQGPLRDLYDGACATFFATDIVLNWIERLSDLEASLSREELGGYADGHRGVCLALKNHMLDDETPTLRLTGINGYSWDPINGEKAIYEEVPLAFVPVRYNDDYPPTDFFLNLGSWSRKALDGFWYANDKGTRSPRVRDSFGGDVAWRETYWTLRAKVVSTKLPHWKHESEHRLIAHGDRVEIADRKLQYRLEDLDGIIFGIKTGDAEKLEIIRTLAAAAADDEGYVASIRFSQAVFSRHNACIEIKPLDLINDRFPHLVSAMRRANQARDSSLAGNSTI